MLVPIKTDEMLFVTQRNQDIRRYGDMTIFMLVEDLRVQRDYKMNQDFNQQIKRNMKPELEARLYAEIDRNFIANQIKYTTFEVPATEIVMRNWSVDAIKAKYLTLLRQKCPTCDAALLIDPSFGFIQKNSTTWRAASNADLLLLNLADGTIRARSLASFVDETSKYDYMADAELVKDASGAARYIPPTVDGLAKVILSSSALSK